MNEGSLFCPTCGKEIKYGADFCECGKRVTPQSPIVHILGIVAAVVIFFVWGSLGGDPDLFEVNAVDYICAIISVILLFAMIFLNRDANKILRIISIILMSLITFFTVAWLFAPVIF